VRLHVRGVPLIEERLYVDGQLRVAEAAGPTKSEPGHRNVIGLAADASHRDMETPSPPPGRLRFDIVVERSGAPGSLPAPAARQSGAECRSHQGNDESRGGATELRWRQSSSILRSNICFMPQHGRNIPLEEDLETRSFRCASRRKLLREAAGVAGCITPWNAPMQVNLAKLTAALGAGARSPQAGSR